MPTSDIATLLDDFVGAREYGQWQNNPKGLGGLEIDDDLVLGGILDRQIAGVLALKDTIDIAAALRH